MDKFLELEEKLKTEKNSFEKFKLFDESVKFGEKAKTGLGLFIVKKTIERYGGFIFVSDNHPKGSVFTFVLKYIP